MMKLARIDITKNKRRERNIQMERDQVNRIIIVLEYLVIRDMSNHLSSEGSRLLVKEYRKNKNYNPAPFASVFDPKKLIKIKLT